MKNKLSLVTLLVIAFLALSFTLQNNNQKTAIVNQTQGIYCFMNCQPVDEYETVFFLKVKVVWSNGQINSVDEIRDMLIRKANKKSISYDALIYDGELGATAIKFK